jgi:hypothetical protein
MSGMGLMWTSVCPPRARPRIAPAQSYVRRNRAAGPCVRLYRILRANQAGPRYCDCDLRVLNRGIFPQT